MTQRRKKPIGRPGRLTEGEYRKIWFSDRQLDLLNVLRGMSRYGPPPFQTVVEQAIESFLAAEQEKSEVREAVAKYDAGKPNVVTLREVKRSNGDS